MPSSKPSTPSTPPSKNSKAASTPPKLPFQLVLVEWADAHAGEGGWLDMGDYQDNGEYIITSAGFVVPEGRRGAKKGHLTLWQTVCDGDGIHPFHIPTGMVRKIHPLNP